MSTATKSTKKPKKKRSGSQPQVGKRVWTAALASAGANGHTSSAFREWATYLGKRKHPVPIAKLLGDRSGGQLHWAVPASVVDEVQLVDLSDSPAVADWLRQASQKPPTASLSPGNARRLSGTASICQLAATGDLERAVGLLPSHGTRRGGRRAR